MPTGKVDKFEIDEKELKESILKVQKNIDKAKREVLEEVRQTCVKITFDLLGEGMRRAPKETGTLRGSGIALVDGKKVATTSNEGGQPKLTKGEVDFGQMLDRMIKDIVAEIVFNVEYATVQHERTDYNHTDGEAKYLEKPLYSNAKHYIEFIVYNVKKRLDMLGGV